MIKSQTKSWRNDARYKVTGETRFTDDLKFHDMLHAVPVYSNYVHAKINSISTLVAGKFPGVVRVITAKDVLEKSFMDILLKIMIFLLIRKFVIMVML